MPNDEDENQNLGLLKQLIYWQLKNNYSSHRMALHRSVEIVEGALGEWSVVHRATLF